MNVKLYKVRLVGGGHVWNYGNDEEKSAKAMLECAERKAELDAVGGQEIPQARHLRGLPLAVTQDHHRSSAQAGRQETCQCPGKEQKMTDQELQALVNLTGLMPCDRLPKKDPDRELKNFLIRVAVNINGAVKRGAGSVQFSDRDTVAPASEDLMAAAKEPLERLGYTVTVSKVGRVEGDWPTATYLTIYGWGD